MKKNKGVIIGSFKDGDNAPSDLAREGDIFVMQYDYPNNNYARTEFQNASQLLDFLESFRKEYGEYIRVDYAFRHNGKYYFNGESREER